MITITLPMPQEKVGYARVQIEALIRDKQEEIRVLYVLLKSIRELCKHEFRGQHACFHCGDSD